MIFLSGYHHPLGNAYIFGVSFGHTFSTVSRAVYNGEFKSAEKSAVRQFAYGLKGLGHANFREFQH